MTSRAAGGSSAFMGSGAARGEVGPQPGHIDMFYNRTRHHSHLRAMNSEQFEAAHKLQMRSVHRNLGAPA